MYGPTHYGLYVSKSVEPCKLILISLHTLTEESMIFQFPASSLSLSPSFLRLNISRLTYPRPIPIPYRSPLFYVSLTFPLVPLSPRYGSPTAWGDCTHWPFPSWELATVRIKKKGKYQKNALGDGYSWN